MNSECDDLAAKDLAAKNNLAEKNDLAEKAVISTSGQLPWLNKNERGAKITRASAKKTLLNI